MPPLPAAGANAVTQPTPVSGRLPLGPTYGRNSEYNMSEGRGCTVNASAPAGEFVTPPVFVAVTEYVTPFAVASLRFTLVMVSVLFVVPMYRPPPDNGTPFVFQL